MRARSFHSSMAAVLAILCAPSSGEALAACKVKVSKTDGKLLVSATGAGGALLWGTDPADATHALVSCQGAPASPKKCQLGDTGTLAARTAPAGCVVHLADGAATCAAWVPGCTVGFRLVDASFPPEDPRILQGVSSEAGGTIVRFSSVNLQVVDGSGNTDGETNSLGNLIVGYNEDTAGTRDRSGSHNLVVGPDHSFSSYGGFVAGSTNRITAPHASVSGGSTNLASGEFASVSGGLVNTASARESWVGGGLGNTASGRLSTVSGGAASRAIGESSSVSGGGANTAIGRESSVSGGSGNTASGDLASISGGRDNTADGVRSSVSGGDANTASGTFSSVSGGISNEASGEGASVSGGVGNAASGVHASVSGGFFNEASGAVSSVSGGGLNEASGSTSSVSGGTTRNASDLHDWRAGGLFQDF
jgi:hypothetical protein